ncbi:hypothetical protein BABINDRAFT_25905, partial [Babjeviella inositovora NRRL Y-12698]
SNPDSLRHRQHPIFQWTANNGVLVGIGNTDSYGGSHITIKTRPVETVMTSWAYLKEFPGPLSKAKTKKKDVEKWIEERATNSSDAILWKVLGDFVAFDGDVTSPAFSRSIASLLTPNIQYAPVSDEVNFSMPSQMSAVRQPNTPMNAHRLSGNNLAAFWSHLQSALTEKALKLALDEGDWPLALLTAGMVSSERYASVAAAYIRMTFDRSYPDRLLAFILHVTSGNVMNAITQLTNSPADLQWAIESWNELVAVVLVNSSASPMEFFVQFGALLVKNGYVVEGHVCFILAGVPLSETPLLSSGVKFQAVGSVLGNSVCSVLMSEVYEYGLASSVANPHTLQLQVKHAGYLADAGLFLEAQKYVDGLNAILKSYGKNVSPLTSFALRDFEAVSQRIVSGGSYDQGWFSGKLSKPNLDKMWGQLDKFIGGD